jgi:type II secretory pathway component GspD/PulD (secretin)
MRFRFLGYYAMFIKLQLLLTFLCVSLWPQDSTRLALPPAVDNVIIEELELNNAPIGEVLRLIASQYGINIFVDPNVDQRVSIFLQNASLRDVLTYLESEYRFDYDIKGDIVKVNPPRAPEPLFHIRFNQSDSLITVRVAAAPFGRVLDSLASALKHSFVYNGRLANEIVKVHLIDARGAGRSVGFSHEQRHYRGAAGQPHRSPRSRSR